MTEALFRLTVPAEPGAVRVIRSVASAAAANKDLAIDRLDDMALAIDEACAALLEDHLSDDLRCVATYHDEGLELAVSVGASPQAASWPGADWEDSLNALVLHAVASDVRAATVADRPTIVFTVGTG